MNICDHCAKENQDDDTFCMGCGQPLILFSTVTAVGNFDPDTFRRLYAERKAAFERKDWAEYRNLHRQIAIECNRKEAVRGERAATLKALNEENSRTWIDITGRVVAGGVKAVWGAFRQSYDSAYEDAKRAREENRQNHRYRQSKGNDRPDETTKPRRSPCEVLGVREDAPWSEIKSAYRKSMMNLHPDRVSQTGMDPKTATAWTQEVNAAYVELEARMSPS